MSRALTTATRDALAERLRTSSPAAERILDDLLDREASSRRNAWVVASVMIVVCAAQAAALAMLFPLKEVQPYTILVDRTTGYVETVRGVQLGDIPEDEAVTHAFLAQYVLARETLDAADFKERYARVALWSDAQARADYLAAHAPDDAEGQIAAMRAGARARVVVKDVDVLDAGTARVRFDRITQDPDGTVRTGAYGATLTFRYSGAPMKTEDRLINPLGFQALTYRRDPEGTGALTVEALADDPVQDEPVAKPAPKPAPRGPAPVVIELDPEPSDPPAPAAGPEP